MSNTSNIKPGALALSTVLMLPFLNPPSALAGDPWVQPGPVPVFALTVSTARAEPVVVENLDIFVDLPTGFVFIKMPQGWKFVGTLDAEALRKLPARVHTSLLPADDEAQALAIPGE